MKRICFFTLSIILAIIAIPAHAQFFIVGTTGLDFSSTKTISKEITTTPLGTMTFEHRTPSSDIEFSINAGAGYRFNSLISLGGTFGYMLMRNSKSEELNDSEAAKTITYYNLFHFHPFARLTAYSWQAVSFYVDLALPLSVGKGTQKAEIGNLKTKNDLGSLLNLGMTITPGIAFKISPNFSLFTNLRFLQVGYNYKRTENHSIKIQTTIDNEHDFYLGTLRHKGIGIGMIYSF